MNIFETAARKKFRFNSGAGLLSTEQLWDLPLTGNGSRYITDLDSVARDVAKELREVTTESFVQTNPAPGKADLETKLDIVKHIIKAKMDAAAAAEKRLARAEERRKLLDALAAAEAKELGAMTREDILAKLSELDNDAA